MPSRIIASVLLIVIQIAIIVTAVVLLSSRIIWLYIPLWIISVVAVAVIINRKGNPSFKLAWIIFILLVPVCGGLLFILWGSGKTTPKFRKRWLAVTKNVKGRLKQEPSVASRLEYEDLYHSGQSRYLYNESQFPVYDNTHSSFLPTGEEFFMSVISDLERAESYIFIEFFILADGELWRRISSVLKKKAAQGVEIKIIFDDFGSLKRQPDGFVERLESYGCEVSVFNPIRPSVDLFMNNRNHRKIIVIDGKISYTGGLNIGDEYVNLEQPFGHWCDCGIRLDGAATKSFTVMFCNMWNAVNVGERLDPADYFIEHAVPSVGFAQPYSDDPLTAQNPAEGLYMQMINSARKYIYITSPYLILDNTMIKQLTLAAKSGVDVRIITPKRWDKWYVHPVTQYYYEELLEAGIKIYEYTPGFIHAKLFVSDDSVATVGTESSETKSLA